MWLFFYNYSEKSRNENSRSIVIGSMDFTEQEILSYMIDELIEKNTDIKG